MKKEQTQTAKELGISGNAFKRIAFKAGLQWELINGKRHFDFDEVLEAIKKSKDIC